MSGEALAPSEPRAGSWRDYVELTKPRIVMMIVITTMAGFYLGAYRFNLLSMIHTIIGTALIAAGSNSLNQYTERDHDRKMLRTRLRPLPDGRISERAALLFGVLISIAGVTYLGVAEHWLPAVLAVITCVTYLFIYTPLKRVTPISTIIGAFPGALPPVIGYTAASHQLTLEAVLIFGILFAWQLPHFMAIGWLYREDYARAGYQMLAVQDPDGRRSGRHAVFYSVMLIIISVLPYVYGKAGVIYLAGALLFGIALLALAWSFYSGPTNQSARRLFMTSNLYLPLIMLLLVVDRR